MITYTHGDILKAQAEALVNTVNCVGFMGRGIAAQFKRAFPKNFDVYKRACARQEVQPGKMLVVETGELAGPRYIINFPTKRHWRGKSRIEDIEAGLEALVMELRDRGIKSVAIPPLGCGLGGLEWADVRPRLERALSTLSAVEVIVYEPAGTPTAEAMARSRAVPNMTPGRAVLVVLIDRYLTALLDPIVTLLEVHKLMYFAQEAGEPLRLKYVKALYGPYAENLRQVLAHIEGHYVTGYADGGDAPSKQLELVPGAVDDAKTFMTAYHATSDRLTRVAQLVEGFETPFGMELLATVHWVATREHTRDVEAAIAAVYSWNDRKRAFTESQIRLAWNVLHAKGWLRQSSEGIERT